LGLFFTACLLIALHVPAYAHPDFPIADTALEIPPGKVVEFPLSVHFHRVVGSFEVISPADGAGTVLVLDDQAFTSYAARQHASPLYSSGKTSQGKLNFLIACCIGEFLKSPYTGNYTQYHLVIDNRESSSATTVELRATLIHDGQAVTIYGAEPFAVISIGGFFGAIGAGLALYLIRRVRGRTVSSVVDSRMERKIVLCSLGSLAIVAAASALGLGLASKGIEAYGGNLVEGFFASNADRPSQYLMFFAWILAVLLWTKSFGMAVAVGSRLVGGIGVIGGVGSLVVGSLLALNYGSILFPAFAAGVVGLPQILGGLYLIQRRSLYELR
jgi:hypothetical protein